MKLINYLMALLVLSSFLPYITQGIRLGKVALSASNNNQDILKISSTAVKESVQHDQLLAKSDIFSSGIKRNLMTKITSFLTTTNDSENQKSEHDPKPQVIKSTHQLAGKKEETSSNSSLQNSKHRVITEQYYSDIAEMDYTPARKKSPIHN
ncbi:hypothetical protein SSX86_002850 [Deinandra increscens subsp. villosa]|uniref:Uncharacterized protein n=1 Tax=Deinandra increscens subsp. villosa TaxID=3103831 RepID=A0AAP0HBP8_9ASTR